MLVGRASTGFAEIAGVVEAGRSGVGRASEWADRRYGGVEMERRERRNILMELLDLFEGGCGLVGRRAVVCRVVISRGRKRRGKTDEVKRVVFSLGGGFSGSPRTDLQMSAEVAEALSPSGAVPALMRTYANRVSSAKLETD